jgi:hypothetical protein
VTRNAHSTETSATRRRQRGSAGLLRRSVRKLRSDPKLFAVLVATGGVVAVVDVLRDLDPVPEAGYAGIQAGNVELLTGPLVAVTSRAWVAPPTLRGLEPAWLAWTVGLEALELLAVVAAVTYVLGRALRREPTVGATLRYGTLLLVLGYGVRPLGLSITVGFPFAILALILFAGVLVRLFAVPGLVVAGEGVWRSIRKSWHLCAGYGWDIFGVLLVLGITNHLVASVPVLGPVGSGAVAAVHACAVGAFFETRVIGGLPEVLD